MRLLRIALVAAIVSAGAATTAHGGLRERFAEKVAVAETDAPQVGAGQTLRYGGDPAQTITFWPVYPNGGPVTRPAPLIVFIHGGGWSRGTAATGTGKWKEAHLPDRGYAFASVDYRLVPQASVEDEAADVAHALASLLQQADQLGIDPRRIVLMGHSAGAHLVALVGTDERYLRSAGLTFGNVAGIVAIDGAGYDVPEQMRTGGRFMERMYSAAFGDDPARQRALSPTLRAQARPYANGKAPRFLLIHVQRPDGVRQAEALEAALRSAGAQVERDGFDGSGLMGHLTINRRLGDPAYPATPVVDRWLAVLFGP